MKEKIPRRKCLRCSHEWFIRKVEARICPKCKSAYWNKAKLQSFSKIHLQKQLSDCCSAEVYEDFKGNDNNSELVEIVRCEKCKCECQIVP